MKIIHCLAWYFPFSTGGTESYVSALAQGQLASGHTVKILVPRNTQIEFPYVFDGIEVDSYMAAQAASPSADPESEDAAHILIDFCSKLNGYDVFHQHSLTTATSVALLSAAQGLGLKTIFTAHVPGIVCLRGTMLEYGSSPCNGLISEQRCGSCWAHSKGAAMGIARLVASIKFPLSKIPRFDRNPPLRRLSSLLRAKQHVNSHIIQLNALNEYADHIVAVCKWLYDSLVSNGVSASKLVLSRQGLESKVIEKLQHVRPQNIPSISAVSSHKHTIFGFIGRWDRVKGIDVAVKAFLALPRGVNASLVIAATGASEDSKSVKKDILKMVAGNDSISVREDVTPDRIASFYGSVDILLVPSTWMETGPMVVLEAIAAGLPVIGSSIGGIEELAELYENIFLANPFVIDSWVSLMSMLATESSLQFKENLGVRSSDHVAREMLAIYSL